MSVAVVVVPDTCTEVGAPGGDGGAACAGNAPVTTSAAAGSCCQYGSYMVCPLPPRAYLARITLNRSAWKGSPRTVQENAGKYAQTAAAAWFRPAPSAARRVSLAREQGVAVEGDPLALEPIAIDLSRLANGTLRAAAAERRGGCANRSTPRLGGRVLGRRRSPAALPAPRTRHLDPATTEARSRRPRTCPLLVEAVQCDVTEERSRTWCREPRAGAKRRAVGAAHRADRRPTARHRPGVVDVPGLKAGDLGSRRYSVKASNVASRQRLEGEAGGRQRDAGRATCTCVEASGCDHRPPALPGRSPVGHARPHGTAVTWRAATRKTAARTRQVKTTRRGPQPSSCGPRLVVGFFRQFFANPFGRADRI